MTPKQKFAATKQLSLVRIEAVDRIQFWCEELKISVFVTDSGIEVCGPDHMGALMISAGRFDELDASAKPA